MSEKQVTLDEMMPLIREQLVGGQSVTFFPRGVSMLPLLREGRDSVTLSAPPERLKKYDIPLYQRADGQYVLHRVVKVGETYTCIGDNQFVREEGISHAQIIAVCSAVTRDGKRTPTNSFSMRFYATCWHYSRFPRRVARAIWRRIVRLFQNTKK